MTRRFRSVARAAVVAALAASLGAVALPGAAQARHDHEDSDWGDRGRHRETRRVYRPGRRHSRTDRGHFRRAYRVHVHGEHCGSRARHRLHRASYHCGPCGHRFQSRSRFHSHLVGLHHVPVWQLRHVIVHSALGWIFHG